MEEDPITRECKITFSQEEKLKKCGFALESEEDSWPPCSVQVTGILMVSPPESNVDALEDDVFHTPPEHQSMSSSDDQGPVKTQVVLGNDRGAFTQSDNVVDLGKDSLALGFSQFKETDGGDCVKDVVFVSDSRKTHVEANGEDSVSLFVKVNGVDCLNDVSEGNTKGTAGFGEDSDTLVFSQLDGGKDVVCDPDLCKVEGALKECKVLESECGESVLNECNVCADERGRKKAIPVRRELPNSFEENEGLCVPQKSLEDLKTFMNLLEAAGIFTDASRTDTDHLKAAKDSGLTFYRPRWWPPQGPDDQFMDSI